jgi:pSer/pThr/pTyr-binding forkhead associated (FHA) protein
MTEPRACPAVDVSHEDEAGAVKATVRGTRVMIGRGADADLRIRELNLARKHCCIESTEAGVWVVDLMSFAGLWTEQRERIPGRKKLRNGERINLLSGVFIRVRWT